MRQAVQGLAHPESNGPSSKNQPLHPTYIFLPAYLPILSCQTRPINDRCSFPSDSFVLACTDSFVLTGRGFAKKLPTPLIFREDVAGKRGESPRTSPVSRKCERVGTEVRTNRDLRGGLPTYLFRRSVPGPRIFDKRAAGQRRAAGVRMNWGRSTKESVRLRPPGLDLPGTKRPTAPPVRTNRYGGSILLSSLHDLFVA